MNLTFCYFRDDDVGVAPSERIPGGPAAGKAERSTGLESFRMQDQGRVLPVLASKVGGDGEWVDVEVLTELSGGFFLVCDGWPGRCFVSGEPAVVHRSKLIPRNNEAVKCLGVYDPALPEKDPRIRTLD